eukprot:1806253-Rhodomonas_salina.1
MPGTDVAYTPAVPPMLLRGVWYCARVRCYAVCSTTLVYGAMRCAVLRERMVLRSCYGMCGTELEYAPTAPSRIDRLSPVPQS